MNAAAFRESPDWYLLQSKPRQAERAEFNLRNQGFVVYRPCIRVERRRRGQRVICQESLFPNYLFIRLQRWVDNWHPIRSTRGVSRLVSFAAEPQPVPEDVVEGIRRRLEDRPAEPWLRAGERVRIAEGCFRGLEAIFQTFDGEQRVVLLLTLLQRQTRLKLPLASVRRLQR